MKNLAAADVLNIWERGLNESLLHRSMIMLAAALPELSPDEIAHLSIGKRDEYLMLLRERLFGTRLVNTAVCPNCSELMEWENRVSDMRSASDTETSDHHIHTVKLQNYRLEFRLPNSADIASLGEIDTNGSAVNKLLKRCVTGVTVDGSDFDVEKLPDHVVVALSERIEVLDPQAEIRIKLDCPNCQHTWPVLFDVASFLWTEIDNWAGRMLRAVHALARAYCWSEEDILNLSPVRRQLYLGLLRS
jgi:hypothetical protein